MRLLLHCCCGPCTTGVAPYWAEQGVEVRGWFFNPNLLPEERRRREEAFAQAATALATDLADCTEGPPAAGGTAETTLLDFLLALAREGGRRCHACYRLRLAAAAREARAGGCDAFSTTLLISPYQHLEALRAIGEEVGAQCGVRFEFVDLRGRFQESRARARELGLYQQKYCGCVFSELERAERRALRRVNSKKQPQMNADSRR